MSSAGRTYWLNARVSLAMRSSRCVFTSVPMPKENTFTSRRDPFTRSRIRSCLVSPIVGCPSVRKMTTYGRSEAVAAFFVSRNRSGPTHSSQRAS